ncbi:phosphatase [Planctomycetales bacterium]|nr:phosphatase [Planctomycetales bacterium]
MEITPFAGYRYNTAKIGNLDDVVAPPYDVIDEAFQEELYAKHPNNVIRLILERMYPTDNEVNNRYSRTAKVLTDWKENGVLVQEQKPAIYVYHQIYEVNGKKYVRKGFMCGCRAIPFGFGMVYPHEITMSGPKLDRLMLTMSCKMNFSQIFGLYPDENNDVQTLLENALVAGKYTASAEAADHLGVIHQMWVVEDEEVLNAVVKAMDPKPIFIADGHHRYETACNYRKQMDEMGLLNSTHPANDVLMVCIAMEDPGLIVLPTHRLFKNELGKGLPDLSSDELKAKLGDNFTTELVGSGADDAHKVWQRIEKENRQDAIGLYTAKDGKWLLTAITPAGKAKIDEIDREHHPEWRELGVSILHRLLVETLLETPEPEKPKYVHQVSEVVEGLKQGGYPLAALVMPATVEHIKTLSLLGDRMPAKSTYFYPKLIAGFVFKSLE